MTHRDVHHLTRVTSTQDVLRTFARAAHLTTVRADEQSCGRGRLGRTWDSGAGLSLLASTLVVLPATPALRKAAGFLTLIGALSMRAALASYGGSFDVKFPNDVVTRGRKICGVLGEFYAEMSAERGELCAAIGVGVNLWQEGDELVAGATSLEAEGLVARAAHAPDLAGDLLDRYLTVLDVTLSAFAADPGAPATAPVIAELNAHLAQRGERVSVAGRTGVVEGIGPDGELVLAGPPAAPTLCVHPADVAMLAEHAAQLEKGPL